MKPAINSVPHLVKTALALLVCIASSAVAEEYQMPRNVVAQVSVVGGFKPIELPVTEGIRILENGKVESFSIYSSGRKVSKLVATLTLDRVAAISAETRGLPIGGLTPEDPTGPVIADIADSTYLARNGLREVVVLEGFYGGKIYRRTDGARSGLPQILDGFLRLAGLGRVYAF